MPSRERRRRRHVLTLKCPAPAGELARNLLHLDSLHEGAEVRPGAQGELEVWSYGEKPPPPPPPVVYASNVPTS